MTDTPIGERVRAWRESHDPAITQQQMAEAIGITQPTLSSFERDQNRRLDPETAVRLEVFTGSFFSADELVRDDNLWLLPALRARMTERGELLNVEALAANSTVAKAG